MERHSERAADRFHALIVIVEFSPIVRPHGGRIEVNLAAALDVVKQRGLPIAPATPVRDRILTTWYPAFRANYEVAQVVSGIPPLRVFWSSLRVKIWASLGAAAYALILPFIIDMNNINNEEGFATVLGVSIICIGVGVWQLRNHSKPETDNQIKNADTRL